MCQFKLFRVSARLILLAGFSNSVQAAITYNVNYSGANISFTGSITTNGAIGQLMPSDITYWSFGGSAKDPLTPFTSQFMALGLGGTVTCTAVEGCSLAATQTTLEITGTSGSRIDFLFGQYTHLEIYSSGDIQSVEYKNSSGFFNGSISDSYTYDSGTINSIFVATAVPEPQAWGMMLASLGMVGVAARRRKKPKAEFRYVKR